MHAFEVDFLDRLIDAIDCGRQRSAFRCHAEHPAALSQSASSVWPEIWHEVGPRAEYAMRDYEGTYDEALPFIMWRKGYPEETYITFLYNPIPDDEGGFGGSFAR